MIVHIVLVKPHEGIGDGERGEVEQALAALRAVPGVLSMTWGKDFSGRSRGHDYGAVLTFESRESLDAYQVDPKHRAVVAVLERLTDWRLIVDYETDSSGMSA